MLSDVTIATGFAVEDRRKSDYSVAIVTPGPKVVGDVEKSLMPLVEKRKSTEDHLQSGGRIIDPERIMEKLFSSGLNRYHVYFGIAILAFGYGVLEFVLWLFATAV
jgi:hypothetical protein